MTAKPGPRGTAQVLLAATAGTMAYLSFFAYRAAGLGAAGVWDDLLRGQGPAPTQYRMGVVWTAHALSTHLHLALPFVLAAIDGLCTLAATLVLFRVFERTEVYRRATPTLRWLGALAFVLLILWFLAWLFWLQKPETLPAALLVALLLLLWQKPASGPVSRTGAATRSLLLLVFTLALAFVRADIACLLNAGVFLFALKKSDALLSLRRPLALATSAGAALLSAAVQLWLMRTVYPQATYGRVKLWQLRPNVIHATRWPPFLIFLLPLAWMVVQVARRRFVQDAAGVAFLVAAILYAALWITIGKIDEVRIFLPFAFALTPLAAQMAMFSVEDPAGR